MVGNAEAIDEAIEALQKNGLVLKIIEGQQNYLSFKVGFSLDKKREKKFGAWVKKVQNLETRCDIIFNC